MDKMSQQRNSNADGDVNDNSKILAQEMHSVAKPGPLGLDIGTSRIVVADGSQNYTTRAELNAFVSVPYSEMVENVLKQRNMVYHRNNGNMFVYGNDSDFFSSFLNANPRRPMESGVLNSREEMGLDIIQAIIKRLVPHGRKGELICFSVPGKGASASGNLVYHEGTLKKLIQSLGYQAKAVNEGQAVVFSELQEENFTGIGISCGGGMCNVCVSFMSIPMITFSIPKAGDYIDSNVAEVLNETSTRVRLFKEEKLDLLAEPKDDLSRALQIYYEDVLQSLIDRLREEFKGSGQLPKIDRPMPIVLAGGTAKPRGFLQKFENLLGSCNFPTEISGVRLAKDPLSTTAHGCYIAALSASK